MEQWGSLEKNQKQPLEKKKICNIEIQNTTEVRIHKFQFVIITRKDKEGEHIEEELEP